MLNFVRLYDVCLFVCFFVDSTTNLKITPQWRQAIHGSDDDGNVV